MEIDFDVFDFYRNISYFRIKNETAEGLGKPLKISVVPGYSFV